VKIETAVSIHGSRRGALLRVSPVALNPPVALEWRRSGGSNHEVNVATLGVGRYSVLSDPRAAGKPWLPIEQRRLSEVPRHLLRIECLRLRCSRVIEIQKIDAVRLYGRHAVLKDVGLALLGYGCRARKGSRDDDGCWPNWVRADRKEKRS